MKDLEEKLAILQRKRGEDKAKIKDLERAKLQLQQVLYCYAWNILEDSSDVELFTCGDAIGVIYL